MNQANEIYSLKKVKRPIGDKVVIRCTHKHNLGQQIKP